MPLRGVDGLRAGWLWVAVAAAAGAGPGCAAQTGVVVPSTPDHPYTLHAYANRVQVATLVLSALHAPEPGLQAQDFTIRLDAGPQFHPLQARVEGDDALNVAVVLDATIWVGPGLLASFQNALSLLPSDLLGEHDHVSVYAADCSAVHAPDLDVPATKASLHSAITSVLGDPKLHGGDELSLGCDGSLRLWDTVAAAGRQIGALSGRRVIVLLSGGQDGKSVNNWSRVREYLDSMSIAVFGMRTDGPPLPKQNYVKAAGGRLGSRLGITMEDPFGLLCLGTGGTVLDVNADTVAPQLARAFRMIRGRYILDFERPRNSAPGEHLIEVSVPDPHAIVLPGGTHVALQDPALAKDPSTVPTDVSHTPVLGPRRGLSGSQ